MVETRTGIRLEGAAQLVDTFCAHLANHDIAVTRVGDAVHFALHGAQARIDYADDRIDLHLSAQALADLHQLKLMVASHLAEFQAAAGRLPPLVWEGDGVAAVRPPFFRVLTVVDRYPLCDWMTRVVLQGQDLERYDTLAHLHCKLMFPRPDGPAPQWPMLGADGLIVYPQPPYRPDPRTYTIRRIDAAAGRIEVDFVLHDIAGPGADWARRAAPGDVVGLGGPGGGGARPADWTLLAGDETALPAIARILETRPVGARGRVIIEVPSTEGLPEMPRPAGFELQWLVRPALPPSGSPPLEVAVRAIDWPGQGSLFVWVGCEFDAFRGIRRYLRDERALSAREHLAVAYWRRGFAEGQAGGRQSRVDEK